MTDEHAMNGNVNGYVSSNDTPDISVESSESASSTSGGNTPGLKGLFIQPFPGGNHSSPIDRFMKGSNKPEEFIPLTNVDDYEISRDERIMYFSNIANYANGRMQDVMLFGYNLKRAKNGQTARDVVTMVSGQRQQQQQDWQSRQGRMFNNARNDSNNPLKSSGNVVGG